MSLFEPHSDGKVSICVSVFSPGKSVLKLLEKRGEQLKKQMVSQREREILSLIKRQRDDCMFVGGVADIKGESEDEQESADPDPCHVSFSLSILLLCFLDEFVE